MVRKANSVATISISEFGTKLQIESNNITLVLQQYPRSGTAVKIVETIGWNQDPWTYFTSHTLKVISVRKQMSCQEPLLNFSWSAPRFDCGFQSELFNLAFAPRVRAVGAASLDGFADGGGFSVSDGSVDVFEP